MSKKLFCLVSFLLVLGMVGVGRSADEIYFTELFDDGNFSSRKISDMTKNRLCRKYNLYYKKLNEIEFFMAGIN